MEKIALGAPFALLCALNAKYIHFTTAPYCLAAGVQLYAPALSCEVLEATVNEDQAALAALIINKAPRVIGFSSYIWNIDKTLRLAKAIKAAAPDTIVILGGPEVSYNAKDILETKAYIDYILAGEGEQSLPALLCAIQRGDTVKGIDGICYRAEDKIIVNPPCVLTDTPPCPYSPEYLSALSGRIAYLETSRGCPYSCAYCLSGRMGAVRFFDMDTTKASIIKLANSGAKTIKLVDRTFNANSAHSNAILRFILDNYGLAIPCGTRFHFEIAGDILSKESMRLFAAAERGAFQLEIGVQSFDENVLKAACRKTDITRLSKNIAELVAMDNMHIHIDLIAGLKGEDLEGFISGFNAAYALGADMLQLGFLKLLHGSPMRENAAEYPCEYSLTAPYEVISTPWISAKELESLRCVEDALERTYNSARFRDTLKYVLSASSLTPYEIFAQIGRVPAGTSINMYIEHLYSRLAALPNINIHSLRDAMVCDYLCCGFASPLPFVLYRPDTRLARYVYLLSQRGYPVPKGVRRTAAVLYQADSLAFVDCTQKDVLTGRFPLHILHIDFFK